MLFSSKTHNRLKKFGFTLLTILLVAGGSLFQQRVLQVNAAVQVLLVSRTAIAFGDVFPGEDPSETYTVQLDTSANSSTYVTTLDTLPGLQNLCPFLNLHSIDSPAEPDTLDNSTLSRPGDVLDKWQVQFNAPGIKGQLSQDHNGGIIIQGGDFGCKITITTTSSGDPGKIIICKQSVGGTSTFNFTGNLGNFAIQTTTNNTSDPCGSLPPCTTGSVDQFADRGGSNDNEIHCSTTVTSSNTSTTTNIVTSGSASGGNSVGSGNGDVKNVTVTSGNSSSNSTVQNVGNVNNVTVTTGTGGSTGSGGKVFDNLQPGTYNITESTTTGWTLTSFVCKDQQTGNIVSQNTASIPLSLNEVVVCTVTNTKQQVVTRTLGFWQTHTQFTSNIFANQLGGSMSIGTAPHKGSFTNTQSAGQSQLFGGFYSSIPKKTNNQNRTSVDQARMQLLQQYIAARLNCGAFGCSATTLTLLANASSAYASGTATSILGFESQLDTYNNSADVQPIPATLGNPGSATPSQSQTLANKAFWDNP